jgi:hypothetical protein
MLSPNALALAFWLAALKNCDFQVDFFNRDAGVIIYEGK